MKRNCGFTLIEVMIAAVILAVAVLSMLGLFTRSLALAESMRHLTIAQFEVKQMMEHMCTPSYQGIRDVYTNNGFRKETPFNIVGLTGKGTVYVNELAGGAYGLRRIKVVVCYRSKGGIVGEDNGSGTGGIALDGIVNGLEDANRNGELDSPCQMETVVTNK